MGFKAIKQHYDIGYIVAIYNEEKYGGDCICIEFKTPSKSSRQTPTQKEWQALAEAHGNKYIVCRSLEDFQQVIRAYIPHLCW